MGWKMEAHTRTTGPSITMGPAMAGNAPSTPPTLAQFRDSPHDRIAGLELRCTACARTVRVSLAALIEQHGPDAVAFQVADRMRCSVCGARPLWWWDRPQAPGEQREYRYGRH